MVTEPIVPGYRDLVRIGRGGLGDVYRATQVSTGATVALKLLRDVSDSSLAWHRTRRELAALVALGGHANVIRLLELLELEQGPGLAMEYAVGGSVASLMETRRERFSVGEAVLVGRQTAAALVAAHDRGIVHRDIKPQNLLIDAYGQVKLCDFGIAALTANDEYRTRTNAVSMRYASPEDLEHDQDVGPPSDVYSLGATLLHLVHGAPPTLKDRLAPWQPPTADETDAAALDQLIARCLQPEPSLRPLARELHAAFDQLATRIGPARVTELPVVEQQPVDPESESPGTAVASSAIAPPYVDEPESDHEATTRYRPRRIGDPVERPVVPRPEPRRRRGRHWWAVLLVGLLVGAIATGVWIVTRPAKVISPTVPTVAPVETPGPVPTAPTTSPPTTVPPSTAQPTTPSALPIGPELAARPEGLPDIRALDWSAGAVGDCLVQVTDQPALAVVTCDEPHDLQRFATGTLDAAQFPPDAPFDDTVRTAVDAACDAALPGFVGSQPEDTVLDRPATIPSDASWAEGDRSYVCFVGVLDQRIVGDARTSGW